MAEDQNINNTNSKERIKIPSELPILALKTVLFFLIWQHHWL